MGGISIMKNILKPKILRKIIALLLPLFFIIIFQKIPTKASEVDKNVLIINSYSTGFYWTDGECEEILKSLDSKENVAKYVEYMDWKRYNSEDSLKNLYEYYKYKYS